MRETFFVSGASAADATGVSAGIDTDDGRRSADDGRLKGCGLVVLGGVLALEGTPIILATGA